MNQDLTRSVTEDEVREAVFDMGPNRTPGPDGFTAGFFQKFWEDIKGDLTREVSSFFEGDGLDTTHNHTNLCLIPKVYPPTGMKEFRPIALCNVAYKIFAKILVNRLKKHLSNIISENQNAFIPGRVITDNIVIAHEVFHSLKVRKRQATSYMAVKTDITKAYDRLEWRFLEKTMKYMGFDAKWIHWIMSCISTVSYSVIINGTPEGHITPQRGIRQGDPLSPYLFILCAEVLSHMMNKAMENRSLMGIKIAVTAPPVNHLLFADDSLFFSLANIKAAKQLKKIFSEYEDISGQSINLSKSSITFGSKVRAEVKTQLRNVLGIHNEGGIGKYLGLPEQFGAKKSEMFEFILERVRAVTQGWKQRHLSLGGKETLLKAVAQAMPIFSMSVFKLPKEVCDAINTILAHFWWSNGDRKGLHWYAWKRVCTPKREGGLGFKDLELFNQALLGKQVWRILQNPHCLMARILKACYFPDCCILEAGSRRKASHGWKSILYGKELIKSGMRYVIGDGTSINTWTDPWIPVHPPRPPRALSETELSSRVSNLLLANRSNWDETKLRELIVEEDVEYIKNIKVSATAQQDLLGWHYNEDGIYTVRSGYWLATHRPDGNIPIPTYGEPELKQKIWKTDSPPKIQHFLWKMTSQCLATGANLKRRHITPDAICKRCGIEEETEKHLFFECSHAKQIWRASGITNNIIDGSGYSFEEKIKECLLICSSTQLSHFQDKPIWILWRLWKSRNMLIFQRKQIHWSRILQYATEDAKEWQSIERVETTSLQRRRNLEERSAKQWTRPPNGTIKCNVDGSFVNHQTTAKVGFIIRDDQGTYKESVQAKGKMVQTALESELQGILMALQHCWIRGYKKIIVESDCQKAVDILINNKLHFGVYNWTREIRWWLRKFEVCTISWVARNTNRVADKLAKADIPNNSLFVFHYFVPTMIHNSLHEDYIRAT